MPKSDQPTKMRTQRLDKDPHLVDNQALHNWGGWLLFHVRLWRFHIWDDKAGHFKRILQDICSKVVHEMFQEPIIMLRVKHCKVAQWYIQILELFEPFEEASSQGHQVDDSNARLRIKLDTILGF